MIASQILTKNSPEIPSNKEIHWDSSKQQLVMDWTKSLGHPCFLTINSWQGGLDWHSTLSGEDELSELLDCPGLDLFVLTENDDLSQWQLTIPKDLLVRLKAYKTHRFTMLRLISQWQEAYDLLHSNPVLLWLWVDHCREKDVSPAFVRQGCSSKQADLMEAVGLPSTPSAARMLKKLKLKRADYITKAQIKKLWQESASLKTLRHCNEITDIHLNLLTRYPQLISTRMFHVLADLDCAWQLQQEIRILQDCFLMRLSFDNQLANCRSLESLHRIHDRHARRMNRGNQAYFSDVLKDPEGNYFPFPPPPHEGTDLIKPITTPEDLIIEGKVMKHCVGSYVRLVQDGEQYVYHMDHPQKATISVHMKNGEVVRKDQAKGVSNIRLSSEAHKIIDNWMIEVLGS